MHQVQFLDVKQSSMQGSPGSISADVKQFSKHEMLETDWGTFTHRNISGIILNHTEVGLYLPISD